MNPPPPILRKTSSYVPRIMDGRDSLTMIPGASALYCHLLRPYDLYISTRHTRNSPPGSLDALLSAPSLVLESGRNRTSMDTEFIALAVHIRKIPASYT